MWPLDQNRSSYLCVELTRAFAPEIDAKAPGTTFKEVSGKIVAAIPFPLSPLAEQHRIVAKVDELMGLCDRLEAAQAGREALRRRLAVASLAGVNASETEALGGFADHVRFVLDTFPALTARADHIKALRQTILNLAVRGKLVPQDPYDEPASELLTLIAKELAAFSKANQVRQAQAELIAEPDQPFASPHGWTWTRLSSLFKVITDGDHQPPPKANEGVAFLTIGNITTGRLDFTGCRLVPDVYFKSIPAYRTPVKGDILYTVVGATYGRAALVETDRAFCVQRHIAILKPAEAMDPRYPLTLLTSPLVYDQATRSTTGTAQPTIALRPLRNFLVPLPPLAEQKRIVAKVDAMMTLCDGLEASLAATAATRRSLLDALLAEALRPEEDPLSATEAERVDDAVIVKLGKAVEIERSALVLTLAFERHRSARRDKTFGHVKAQKILHLVEAETDFDLGRAPIRDAAGPNDFQHMLHVEDWAQEHQRFKFVKNGNGYIFKPLSDYPKILNGLGDIDAVTRSRIEKIIDLFIPMDMEKSELFATVYAAWNNLLIEGKNPEDAEIVRAAREEWHPRKLKISHEKFVAALRDLRRSNLIPNGRGKFVPHGKQQDMFLE